MDPVLVGPQTRREALREIARERAREEGKLPPEGKEEAGAEGLAFKQASPDTTALINRRDADWQFAWSPFTPWKKETVTKKKPKFLNTVTIWVMARKMMDREWRRALGVKKKRDPRVVRLEREAAIYGEKKEAERKKREEQRKRFEDHRARFAEVLQVIGQKIYEHKDNLTINKATDLIEEAMASVAKVYNVEWTKDGCEIFLEPWEERWSRRNPSTDLPTIYRLAINTDLEMVSYDLVEEEEDLLEQKQEMLARQLATPSREEEEEELGTDEEDIQAAFEKRVAGVGRMVSSKRLKQNAWLATVEPWEDMRIRNVERKGQGPLETKTVIGRVVDGKMVVTPVKETDVTPVKETAKTDRR